MQALLRVSASIDRLSAAVGRSAMWLVLAAVLISAINAVVRKVFSVSSNAFLELQWYLFSAVFLLCAPYALLKNEHVRIDVVSARFTQRGRVWMELVGTLLFLLPIACLVLYLSWHVFLGALESGEVSPNAGGLALWPARLLVPVGFALLILQAVSQTVKCWAFLRGAGDDPLRKEAKPTAEEALAESIRQRRAGQGA